MSNVYDVIAVRKVSRVTTKLMKVLVALLTSHGIEPSAVKSDLYTLVGIDSSHPSKLRSSLWRPDEVIEGGKEAVQVRMHNDRAYDRN